jgi:tetratricopeptide (TPR) repeat protein
MERGKIMSRPYPTKSNHRVRLFKGTSLAIYLISGGELFVLAGFLLLLISGCSSVGGEVQAGRNALQTNRPEAAVAYLASAAEVDPTYRIPYRVPAGVLGYLGRAYLETGRPAEARRTLEQALKINPPDPFVPLYLGTALMQTGERDRGRKEIEAGLRGIHETLQHIASDNVSGIFWDPTRVIRSTIEKTLGSDLGDSPLEAVAVQIGADFEEEIDEARRDESLSRRGAADSSGN